MDRQQPHVKKEGTEPSGLLWGRKKAGGNGLVSGSAIDIAGFSGQSVNSHTVTAFLILDLSSSGDMLYSSENLFAAVAAKSLHVQLCATPQTAAHQAPPSLGFSGQEHWSELPCPSPVHAYMLSCFTCIQLCATLWTAAHQAPLSTGLSRQEYWSGLSFPSPESVFSFSLLAKCPAKQI